MSRILTKVLSAAFMTAAAASPLAVTPAAAQTPTAQSQGGFPYARFQPRTAAEFAKSQAEAALKLPSGGDKQASIDAVPERARLRMVYTGESRLIGAGKKVYVTDFLEALSQNPALGRLFEREYRFTEAGQSYWLPVQGPVAAFFADEVKVGESIDLYATMIGSFGTREALEIVGLVEEFQTIETGK